jgi:drug/metabolite transporter (DMT)-like permease
LGDPERLPAAVNGGGAQLAAAGGPPPVTGAERRALWMLVLSSVCFGVMAFAAKLAAGTGMGGAQVAAVRFASGLLPLLFVASIRRQALTWQRLDLLVYRGVFGGIAVLLYFLAIDHVPVGLATLLNYTAPIFSTFFAARFIGEPAQRGALPALAIALAGVFLVVRSHSDVPGLGALLGPWTLAGLFSAVLSGAAVTAIRVARRTESSWAVYTSFNALGLVATAPFAIAAWRAPTMAGWGWLLAVGVTSMVAQLLMTHAYRWVDNLRAGVVAQLAVFVAMAFGATFLGEPVTTGTVVGSILTVAGVLVVVAGQGRRPAPGRPIDP